MHWCKKNALDWRCFLEIHGRVDVRPRINGSWVQAPILYLHMFTGAAQPVYQRPIGARIVCDYCEAPSCADCLWLLWSPFVRGLSAITVKPLHMLVKTKIIFALTTFSGFYFIKHPVLFSMDISGIDNLYCSLWHVRGEQHNIKQHKCTFIT
jgi:hypothetical protein